ncbi:MAG: glycosyltransferase family 2 protein [Muribaculaceae bacterium]|nr:glycosyltransferase family 2 protein [Muribaculaceae bacterium]
MFNESYDSGAERRWLHGLTVVVPVYNRADLLVRCLDSIRSQSLRPLRLIVVDNASTDDTLQVAEKWTQRYGTDDFSVSVISENRRGACHARQAGLNRTETEYVMFFDSDDMMHSDMAMTAFETLQGSKKPDIAAWPVNYNFLDGARRQTPGPDGDPLDSHLIHATLRTVGYAVRTDVLRRAGGWDNDLKVWDDWELGVRLLSLTDRVEWVSRPMAEIYSQAESLTGLDFSSRAGAWEEALDRIENVLRNSKLPRRRHYLNLVDYRRTVLAAQYSREGREDLAVVLLGRTLNNSRTLTGWQKRLVRMLYKYTARGHRGAGRIAVRML